ncbi:hypothetical protein [Bacteroides thetaiotaomicron]|uniref:hypothetical protein n=1 Tax=Bacteroides thetaiotaomicron TaxID=818 RepID=UPI001F5B733E|nr:hypothetical protein [Bacteroides thetaiotaomicron]
MEKCVSLVSLCLLFEDVNAQTTKNRYYKANDETFLTWTYGIQSDGSVSFDWTGTYLRTDFRRRIVYEDFRYWY